MEQSGLLSLGWMQWYRHWGWLLLWWLHLGWSWPFLGIMGTQDGAGEGLFVPSGDPKLVFRSFSWVADGPNGFLVRNGIALDPLGVSITHLVAPGAPKTGRVHSRQKLTATNNTKGTRTIPPTHFLRTPRPPLDSARNSASHTALWLTQTRS